MKLNVINRDHPGGFHEAVGINEERANELSGKLDAMVKKFPKNEPVYISDIMSEIAEMCNNLEEVMYCVINHCNWAMTTYGIIYCPTKKKV